jgi:hypothetical protein
MYSVNISHMLDIEFLTVVHRANIGLLRLTAISISHSRYAHVPWRVCVQDRSVDLVRAGLLEWPHIEIIDVHDQYSSLGGWQAQQMIKLDQAAQSHRPWCAIIGPGNILLEDQVFSDSDLCPYAQLDSNPRRFHQYWSWALASRGIPADTISRPSVLTPWAWRTDVVRSLLVGVTPLRQWPRLLTTEQYLYWAWADGVVQYRPRQLISGMEYLLKDQDYQWYQTELARGVLARTPWWLLHRTAYQGDPRAVRLTLDLMANSWRITDQESAEFWRDYLQARWH